MQPNGVATVQFFLELPVLLNNVILQAFEQAPVTRTSNVVVVGATLRAAEGQRLGGTSVTAAALSAVRGAAIRHWEATGLTSEESLLLRTTPVRIVDLADGLLGRTLDGVVYVDTTGAGAGWYVDESDQAFAQSTRGGERLALAGGPSDGRHDLLTALVHEFGHVLGYSDSAGGPPTVMTGSLQVGTRRLPPLADPSLDASLRSAIYQNPVSRFDVNLDGRANATDLILMVTELRHRGTRRLSLDDLGGKLLDVDGNGLLSTRDAIDLLMALSAAARAASGGEGESMGTRPREEPAHDEQALVAEDTLSQLAVDVTAEWASNRAVRAARLRAASLAAFLRPSLEPGRRW